MYVWIKTITHAYFKLLTNPLPLTPSIKPPAAQTKGYYSFLMCSWTILHSFTAKHTHTHDFTQVTVCCCPFWPLFRWCYMHTFGSSTVSVASSVELDRLTAVLTPGSDSCIDLDWYTSVEIPSVTKQVDLVQIYSGYNLRLARLYWSITAFKILFFKNPWSVLILTFMWKIKCLGILVVRRLLRFWNLSFREANVLVYLGITQYTMRYIF